MNRQNYPPSSYAIPDGEGFNALPIFFAYLTLTPALSQREMGV
jgi:hypothetical protein